MSAKSNRDGFIESCQALTHMAAGYNYMISTREWRELAGELQSKFSTMSERAKEKPPEANFPQFKQIRIDFADNLEHGIRLYSQRPEIFFDLVFAYLLQGWQVFLDEITQGEFEWEKYSTKFKHVKERLNIIDFPSDLESRTKLYVAVRNNLQHSRRKLRQSDLEELGVKEFELLYKIDGTKKKYKAGDTVVITVATVFEAANDFIKSAEKLVP